MIAHLEDGQGVSAHQKWPVLAKTTLLRRPVQLIYPLGVSHIAPPEDTIDRAPLCMPNHVKCYNPLPVKIQLDCKELIIQAIKKVLWCGRVF